MSTRFDSAKEPAKLLERAFFDKAVELFGSSATAEALVAMAMAAIVLREVVEKAIKVRFPTPDEMLEFLDGEL